MAKVATSKISPRELVQLKHTLNNIKPIKELLKLYPNQFIKKIENSLDNCDSLISLIDSILDDEAPVIISKGNVIKNGFNSDLDKLRTLSKSGKDYLDEILEKEKDKIGISSLKINFNNVFGYYIEVRNSHKDKVPETWTRKQTLVNAERYITEELKEYEGKILGAEDRILAIEQTLFNELVSWMHSYILQVQQNAQLIAQLDCLGAFANLAKQNNYT